MYKLTDKGRDGYEDIPIASATGNVPRAINRMRGRGREEYVALPGRSRDVEKHVYP